MCVCASVYKLDNCDTNMYTTTKITITITTTITTMR